MGVRNARKKEHKQSNGEAPNLSESPASFHYNQRSSERSKNGGVVPFHRKKINRMIARGKAKVIKKDSSGKRVKLPTGEIITISKKNGKGITYFPR
ncbi:MAG: hypothetical protein WC349_04080 [Patescibacteria group bacterium]